MKKIIVVAQSLFSRRIKKPNYYWMIVAPLQIKDEIIQQNSNSKNHLHLAKSNFKSLKQAKLYLNDGNLDGILYVHDSNLTHVKYFYKKQSADDSVTKNLEQILYSIKIQNLAVAMKLTTKQLQDIVTPVKISSSSINSGKNKTNHFGKMQLISQFIVIGGFLLLTSYISITGSEIGREKGDHLIERVLSLIPTHDYFAGCWESFSY